MKVGFLRAALVLGLLQAIGPFAIDMYLPALPSIGQNLGAGVDAVQASLMVFFIALAVGQLRGHDRAEFDHGVVAAAHTIVWATMPGIRNGV